MQTITILGTNMTALSLAMTLEWFNKKVHFKKFQIILISSEYTLKESLLNESFCFDIGLHPSVHGMESNITRLKSALLFNFFLKDLYVNAQQSVYIMAKDFIHQVFRYQEKAEENIYQLQEEYNYLFHKLCEEFHLDPETLSSLAFGSPNTFLQKKDTQENDSCLIIQSSESMLKKGDFAETIENHLKNSNIKIFYGCRLKDIKQIKNQFLLRLSHHNGMEEEFYTDKIINLDEKRLYKRNHELFPDQNFDNLRLEFKTSMILKCTKIQPHSKALDHHMKTNPVQIFSSEGSFGLHLIDEQTLHLSLPLKTKDGFRYCVQNKYSLHYHQKITFNFKNQRFFCAAENEALNYLQSNFLSFEMDDLAIKQNSVSIGLVDSPKHKKASDTIRILNQNPKWISAFQPKGYFSYKLCAEIFNIILLDLLQEEKINKKECYFFDTNNIENNYVNFLQ